MDEPHSGGCACGAVRYRVHGKPAIGLVCHCTFCQRRLASAFAVMAYFDENSVEFVQGQLVESEYRSDTSGRWLKMSFCPTWNHGIAHRRATAWPACHCRGNL